MASGKRTKMPWNILCLPVTKTDLCYFFLGFWSWVKGFSYMRFSFRLYAKVNWPASWDFGWSNWDLGMLAIVHLLIPDNNLVPTGRDLFNQRRGHKGNEGFGDEFWLSDQTKILWGNKVWAELARLSRLTNVIQIGPLSSSGASFLHRRKRETRVTREWLVAKRKGPWEGEEWEESDVLSVFSFPPSFARKIHRARERHLGTRH